MSARQAAVVAWSTAGLSLVLAGAGLVLAILCGSPTLPHGADDPVGVTLPLAGVVLPFAVIGALVASRRRENVIGWLFCGVALLLAVDALAHGWADYSLYAHADLPATDVAAWVTYWLVTVPLFIGPLFLLLLFPDGRLLSRRWRPVAWGVAVLTACTVLNGAFSPGPLEGHPTVMNPVGAGGWLGRFFHFLPTVEEVLAPALFLAAATSLVLRLRRSGGRQRQQLKLVVYTASMAAVAFVIAFVTPEGVSSVIFGFGLIALAGIPVAAGVAILRYRLYDIDRVINRTLVYAALTACLGLVYVGSVLLLQLALRPLTSRSDLAIAGSTLAVAALFRPARSRIQEAVDHRFYRRKYNAERTLESFSAHLRDEVDLDALAGELRQVVAETMQPRHVSLWLRAPEAGR